MWYLTVMPIATQIHSLTIGGIDLSKYVRSVEYAELPIAIDPRRSDRRAPEVSFSFEIPAEQRYVFDELLRPRRPRYGQAGRKRRRQERLNARARNEAVQLHRRQVVEVMRRSCKRDQLEHFQAMDKRIAELFRLPPPGPHFDRCPFAS